MAEEFDLVVVAQRLGCLGPGEGQKLLSKAIKALKFGGKLVVIDLFRGPAKPDMSECVEALKLELGTQHGSMRTLEAIQTELTELGLENAQVTFMPDSRVNMGSGGSKSPFGAVLIVTDSSFRKRICSVSKKTMLGRVDGIGLRNLLYAARIQPFGTRPEENSDGCP